MITLCLMEIMITWDQVIDYNYQLVHHFITFQLPFQIYHPTKTDLHFLAQQRRSWSTP